MLPERLDRTVIYESDWINLYTDKVRYPDGLIVEKYHVLHSCHDSVCVIVENEKDEILLIRSNRYVTGREEWEVPAGRMEEKEDELTAAIRETREETGYEIKEVRKICSFNPNNGMSDLTIHLFHAKAGSLQNRFDENEVKDIVWISKEAVKQMLKDNEIQCGVSMIALFYAILFH
jgi:8-oxo-dGTP pyrophosphatase MutT (NUDIX family)